MSNLHGWSEEKYVATTKVRADLWRWSEHAQYFLISCRWQRNYCSLIGWRQYRGNLDGFMCEWSQSHGIQRRCKENIQDYDVFCVLKPITSKKFLFSIKKCKIMKFYDNNEIFHAASRQMRAVDGKGGHRKYVPFASKTCLKMGRSVGRHQL